MLRFTYLDIPFFLFFFFFFSRKKPDFIPGGHCCCHSVTWLCPTLCDPMDFSLPGSSVHRILQARILEWVDIPFSKGFSWPRDWTWVFLIAGKFFTIWATRESYNLIFNKCFSLSLQCTFIQPIAIELYNFTFPPEKKINLLIASVKYLEGWKE